MNKYGEIEIISRGNRKQMLKNESRNTTEPCGLIALRQPFL